MKLQIKTTALMIIIGCVLLSLLTFFYANHNRGVVLEKELQNIKNIAEDSAQHMSSHLKENAAIAKTLSSAPIIRNALLKSNTGFDKLSDSERIAIIERQNSRWKETRSIEDPFVQSRMTNPTATYLKLQQQSFPGQYGEIFVTNKHGVMIATTGKLTTLAHAHKYWWKAGYNGGEGKIFYDDRGFDTSVEGYVLGIVVPVRNNGEIIGILKCNVNIMGPLTDVLLQHKVRDLGRMNIVRTKGLIVAETGKTPLSETVDEIIHPFLQSKTSESAIVESEGVSVLLTVAPIKITMGSATHGFGGSYESIDHIYGNKGEGWHVVIVLDKSSAVATANQTTQILILAGILFTLITSLVAWLLGWWIAKPLVSLTQAVQKIGSGRLDARIDIVTQDEIGTLAEAFNDMAENLEQTLTSRDNLIQEIERRKKAEEEIKILHGLLPICASCKKIRDEKGYWNQIESYIEKHSDALFSHGICPECAEELYGDTKWYKKRKKEGNI